MTVNDISYNPDTRRTAMFLGLLFLTATATFTTGDALVLDALGGAEDTTDSEQLTLGVTLQAINAFTVAAIGAAFVPVLSHSHRGLAYGHLAVRILECLVILGIGAYMLADHTLVNYEPVIYVFTGTAGLMLTYVLLRSGLVPTWLARTGVIGYIAILAALPVELLNLASLDTFPGMLLYVPGGLFELVLPVLLIARGFRRTDRPTVHANSGPEPAPAHA
jgi:Domain of unknown function (DUF4386)